MLPTPQRWPQSKVEPVLTLEDLQYLAELRRVREGLELAELRRVRELALSEDE
jgi:hypothetical protein